MTDISDNEHLVFSYNLKLMSSHEGTKSATSPSSSVHWPVARVVDYCKLFQLVLGTTPDVSYQVVEL